MGNPSARRGRPDRLIARLIGVFGSPLLDSCVRGVMVALLVLVGAWIMWGWAGLDEQSPARATVALTTVGGLGGSVFLIVKYRAQELVEEQHLISRRDHGDEMIDKALELFASTSPLKRVSGARQLIRLSDGHDDIAYQQRIVNEFCTFLKLSQGRCVEDILIEKIFLESVKERASGSREGSLSSWCKCRFDFRGICFASCVDLSMCVFQNRVDWTGARFLEDALFSGATFEVSPLFSGVDFGGMAKFDGCKFKSEEDVDFSLSLFKGKASFVDVSFGGGVSFGQVRSKEDGSGDDAFDEIPTFCADADFSGAVFGGEANFGLSGRVGEDVPVCCFEGSARFEGATFERGAYFGDVQFMNGAFFNSRREPRPAAGGRGGASGSPCVKVGNGRTSFDVVAYFRGAYFHTDGKDCLRFDRVKVRRGDFRDCVFGDRDLETDGLLPSEIAFRGVLCDRKLSFENSEVTCKKHKSRLSNRVWPKGLPLKGCEEGDIPVGAYCPECENRR